MIMATIQTIMIMRITIIKIILIPIRKGISLLKITKEVMVGAT